MLPIIIRNWSIHSFENSYIPFQQANWTADRNMEAIRAKLADRLNSKGLENNETELFIKDVIRIIASSPGFDIDAIKGQLNLLGWHDDYTDYGTIQLIQARYQDG